MAEHSSSYRWEINSPTITKPDANSHPYCSLKKADKKTVFKYHIEKKVAFVRPTFYKPPDPSIQQLRRLVQDMQLTEYDSKDSLMMVFIFYYIFKASNNA